MEGHECGHQNYSSNLSETEIYRWNCKWDFISSLAAAGDGARNWIFTKYERGFSKERCGSIRTLSANSRKVHGYLEDAFIEEQMCRRFPGSIRQGILQNRKRNMEQISSLKSQIVQKKSKLKIMLLLLVQYMFTHKVNVWDGEVAEYMELLRNCIPVLFENDC